MKIKKILLTGGSGMVGKNFIKASKNINFKILSPNSKKLNLQNYHLTNEFLKKNKPDIIVHCAAKVGGIQHNIKNPVKMMVENIDITKNIIMSARENNIKKLINVASSCMYPHQAKNPLDENLILTGTLEPTNEGYAIAKIFSARLCEYISREDKSFEYKTIIPPNLYGIFDSFEPHKSHAIASIINKIYHAKINNIKKVEIWGDGKSRREFMFSQDLVNFIIYGIKNFKKMPSLMNVGTGKDYTINQYYKIVAKELDWKGTFFHNLSKPTGMKQKLVSIKKQKKFGWVAKNNIKEGIAKTCKYYIKTIEK